ncbi:DNA primase family protein [Frankia tisae]|uniref:DNA primase family protein n=1 Tax=Frankia tisae TaxID=2950104 RepID=UPI0021C1ECFD|nr:DNA primase family protein [Frankia tisae]
MSITDDAGIDDTAIDAALNGGTPDQPIPPLADLLNELAAADEITRRGRIRETVRSLINADADAEQLNDYRQAITRGEYITSRIIDALITDARKARRAQAKAAKDSHATWNDTINHARIQAKGQDGAEVHSGQLRWALRFAERHAGEYIHTPGRGWFVWAGSHWKPLFSAPGRPPAEVTRAILALAREAFTEMADLPAAERDDLYEDIRKVESESGVKGAAFLASIQLGIAHDDDQLDPDPDLIACRNGTFDLTSNEFRSSQPSDLNTRVLGCDYDPTATCPTYDAGMARWQPDPQMRAYIHRIGGSALQGRVTEQTLPVFHGKGANGKGSTLNDSWLPVFGDYGRVVGVEVLMSNPSGNSYLPQKAALVGARLIVTSEPEAGMRFNGGTLKLLTGGNKIDAAAKYKAPIQITPTWQIIMECNTRPDPPADDDAVWRRLRQVGWDVVIPEAERDPTLPQQLAGELPGILNRLLDGWRDYRDNGGIRVPDAVATATKVWRQEVDTLGQFLNDECYRGETHQVRSSALYARWVRWCKANGEDAGSNKAFSEALKKKDFAKRRAADGVRWSGLMLRPDRDDDE